MDKTMSAHTSTPSIKGVTTTEATEQIADAQLEPDAGADWREELQYQGVTPGDGE